MLASSHAYAVTAFECEDAGKTLKTSMSIVTSEQAWFQQMHEQVNSGVRHRLSSELDAEVFKHGGNNIAMLGNVLISLRFLRKNDCLLKLLGNINDAMLTKMNSNMDKAIIEYQSALDDLKDEAYPSREFEKISFSVSFSSNCERLGLAEQRSRASDCATFPREIDGRMC